MKKSKLVILSIVLLIVLIILLPSILNLFTSDIDPIDDSDLKLQLISIPDEENAYFDLIKIKDVLYEPEGKRKEISNMANNNIWNQKLAEEIISNNQEAFELFSKAAQKTKYQNPEFAIPEKIKPNTMFPVINSLRIMSEYSSIKAIYLSKQGQVDDALNEALNSVFIGQKIQESQVSFLEYLVAMALKERGLGSVQKIVSLSDFDNIELKKYISKLNQFYQNEDGLITTAKGEYLIESLTIDSLVNGNTEMLYSYTKEQSQDIAKKLENNYYFRPNKTKEIFAGYTRNRIEDASRFCNNIENIEIKKLTPSSYFEIYISENIIGKVLHDVIANSFSSVNTKKCNEDTLVSATQALLSIKAYQNDNGDLPDSLNQLVPDYLESVPLDYFNGNQLRYSKDNRILYSVGKDGKDEGGSEGKDWKEMADPTFYINF